MVGTFRGSQKFLHKQDDDDVLSRESATINDMNNEDITNNDICG